MSKAEDVARDKLLNDPGSRGGEPSLRDPEVDSLMFIYFRINIAVLTEPAPGFDRTLPPEDVYAWTTPTPRESSSWPQ